MIKIRVKELKDVIKSMDIKKIKTVDFNGLSVEIIQYLPFLEKINLISTIYKSAVNIENNLCIVDRNALEIAYRVFLVDKYTNLTLPQTKNEEGKMEIDVVGSFDLLTESGLFTFIYEAIPYDEVVELEEVLERYIQEKKDEYNQKNTIQFIIKDLLNGLINKMPDEEGMKKLIEDAKNTVEGFDPSKMEYINEFMKLNRGE